MLPSVRFGSAANKRVLAKLAARATKEGRDRDAALHRLALKGVRGDTIVENRLEDLEAYRDHLMRSAKSHRLSMAANPEFMEAHQRELAYDEILLEEIEMQINALKRGRSNT